MLLTFMGRNYLISLKIHTTIKSRPSPLLRIWSPSAFPGQFVISRCAARRSSSCLVQPLHIPDFLLVHLSTWRLGSWTWNGTRCHHEYGLSHLAEHPHCLQGRQIHPLWNTQLFYPFSCCGAHWALSWLGCLLHVPLPPVFVQ